jgi:hypothetical protein
VCQSQERLPGKRKLLLLILFKITCRGTLCYSLLSYKFSRCFKGEFIILILKLGQAYTVGKKINSCTSCTGSEPSRRLKLSGFSDNRHMTVANVVTLMHRPP